MEARIQRGPGCWLWTGNVNRKGYGYIQFMGKSWLAHRLLYTLSVGPIPPGLAVCHHCDNPPCVRPDHLFIGSLVENNRDMLLKGRASGPKRPGPANSQAKLTWRDVEDIRFLYATEAMNQWQLASEFGISQAQVWRIVHNKTWIVARNP